LLLALFLRCSSFELELNCGVFYMSDAKTVTLVIWIVIFLLVPDAKAQTGNCPALQAPQGATVTVSPAQASQLPAIVHGVTPGTTVLLEDGTYLLRSYIRFEKSGVVLRSLSGNRDAVVIDGQYEGYMLQVAASNVTIADLTLKRAYYHLVHVVGGGDHVTLHNLNLIDARQQFVKVNGSAGSYPDNGKMSCSSFELTAAGRSNIDPSGGGCYSGGFDALSVRDWHVHDNYFENIYCTNGALPTHMVLFWRSARDPIVERNTIVNCARGIGFGLGSTGGSRVYPDNPTAGVGGEVGHIGGMIRNNSIFGDIGSYFDTGIGLEQAWNVKVYNNTVYSTGGTFSSIDSRFTNSNPDIANNVVRPNMTNRSASPQYRNNVQGAESVWFVDASNGDLHIVSTASSLIDQGISLGADVTDDIDAQNRNGNPDLGADEYYLSSPALTPTAPSGLRIAP
jgi:hypothetical protein